MRTFDKFCDIAEVSKMGLNGGISKLEVAVLFIWYHQFKTQQFEITIKEINQYFIDAHLAPYNVTFLKRDLGKSAKVTKGTKVGTYKLNRKTIEQQNARFLPLLNVEVSVSEIANINITPYQKPEDIENARRMAELYLIIHCLENSVRSFIEDVLANKYGQNWWDYAKNSELEKKIKERKEREGKNKWLSPRGASSSLFYLDWGDLVKIIKKLENDFSPQIDDVRFVQHRLDDMEKVRNIVAHNGVIPSKDDFDRVVLHFKDWCKQIKK